MTSRTFEQGTDGRPGAEARPDGRPPAEARRGERTLADLTPSATAQVVSVSVPDSPAVARRLADLGFTPGTEVRMLRRAPLRDPLIYLVKDYEICLRRAQASCVNVVEVDG
ncbi:FeoA family protein [Salinispora vitiensis]|uniref:FeoA family protein n=1 Tax=Salinispora vitiensis TaxID=999544 RepID=UPI000372AE4D|nr:FeoA family protein [Salinispora vitiensis]